MLAHNLSDIGYQLTHTNPYIWIKLITIHDGRGYYALVLIYGDEILHVRNDTINFMNKIRYIYRLKDGVGELDQHLGANK